MSQRPLPAGLPAPVRRYLEAVGAPAPAYVEAGGPGAIREALVGRHGTWLDLAWELQLVPGRELAWRGSGRAFGLMRIRVVEELRDGRGRLAIGKRVVDGPDVDRAQATLLWAWTLALAPGHALDRSDVTWEPHGPVGARVLHAHGTELLESLVRFDGESGLLRCVEARRWELAARRTRSWTLELDDWRELGGRLAPGAAVASWEGEPALRLTLTRLDDGR